MGEEYNYNIGKYTIGVDTNGEDGIGLTVAIIENDKINFLGSCYGDNARCIDLLIRENQELKKQLEVGKQQYNDLVEEKEKLQEQLSSNTLQFENQQKEFVEWLEKEISSLEKDSQIDCINNMLLVDVERDKRLYQRILSKYKKIIGDKE